MAIRVVRCNILRYFAICLKWTRAATAVKEEKGPFVKQPNSVLVLSNTLVHFIFTMSTRCLNVASY